MGFELVLAADAQGVQIFPGQLHPSRAVDHRQLLHLGSGRFLSPAVIQISQTGEGDVPAAPVIDLGDIDFPGDSDELY